MSLALVLYEPPPTKALAARLTVLGELEERVEQLEAEHVRMQDELLEFEKRFRPAVGDRFDELELIRERIRAAWEQVNLARNGGIEPTAEEIPDEHPQEAFRPEQELRALFRTVARRIHPDLGEDYEERKRRHEFMAEATHAYRAGDHRRLQWLLEHWEAAPRLPHGHDPASRIARVNQQIAWTRYRVRELNAEIAALGASSLAQLVRQAREARLVGRNLVVEMRNEVLKELDEARLDLARVEDAIGAFDDETVRIIRANAGLED